MQSNFAASIALVLRAEGGYADNAKDPGGATNMGITRATLAAWRGVPVNRLPKSEVRNLAVAEATTIYRARYWTPIYADDLPAGLDYAVMDYAVNSGPSQAAKDLQRVLGVTVDGRIGPKTVAASKAAMPGVIDRLCDARLAFLRGLSTWATFGKGWASRVESVRKAARDMAAGAEMPEPIVPPTIYMQPKAKAAEKAMVKAALASDGSRTIGATDAVNKAIAVGGTGLTGLTILSQLTDALKAVPPWGYFLGGALVLGVIFYFNRKVVLARVDDALSGAHIGRDIGLVPAAPVAPPEATAAPDEPTQPVPAPASPDADAGQTEAPAPDPAPAEAA